MKRKVCLFDRKWYYQVIYLESMSKCDHCKARLFVKLELVRQSAFNILWDANAIPMGKDNFWRSILIYIGTYKFTFMGYLFSYLGGMIVPKIILSSFCLKNVAHLQNEFYSIVGSFNRSWIDLQIQNKAL